MVLDLIHTELFSFSDGSGFGENVIMSGVDMSWLVHIDNKNKDILTLGKGLVDDLDDNTLTIEKKYSTNFTEEQKKNLFKLVLKWGESLCIC